MKIIFADCVEQEIQASSHAAQFQVILSIEINGLKSAVLYVS